MEYQYGQNNDEQNNSNAWNNEWSNNSQANDNPYQQNNLGNGSGKDGSGGGKGGNHNNKKSGKGLLALIIVLVLVVGIAAGVYVGGVVLPSDNESAALATETETESTELQEEESTETSEGTTSSSVTDSTASESSMSVEEIASSCLPSIVAITNKGETEILSMWGTMTQESESEGSGVIIGETDDELLILTNYHVVEGNDSLSVLFSYQEDSDDPEIATAKVKDYDENEDIAVISIDLSTLSSDVLDNIKVATIGDSSELALGEQVVAIGNALGYGQSVTTGIVSALNRTVEMESEDGSTTTDNEYIQTDAAINPGNSGGGLFNMAGELVGLNSAKVSSEEVEGMGYSIPISDVKDEIEEMMNTETRDVVDESERGYLGISGSNVTSDINEAYGIPEGVYISAVTEGSPAEDAGLEKGMVITELNGKTIASIESLKDYLSYYQAGEDVTLTVEVQGTDGYTEETIDVTLGTEEEAGISSDDTSSDSDSSSSSATEEAPSSGSDGSSSETEENPYSDFFNYFNQQNGN